MAASGQVSVEDEFVRTHRASQHLYEQQARIVPGGVTHSSRIFDPFPLFIRSSHGSHKHDVDGHEYVDYWMGHGANLLGHGHPAVIEAVTRQSSLGFHGGGENETALRWAEAVCDLVPSAEKVRFCASGGEATQMAIRVARAFTGRDKIVKFQYHFHGWHDAVAHAIVPPFEKEWSSGVSRTLGANTLVVPFNDLETITQLLANDDGIAGVILEPAGGNNDTIPVDIHFLRGLREITRSRGVLLIFDEVVTGFRYSPGGAQQYFGVAPDLTTLGKILGGGLPAGALAGRADVMDVLAPRSPGDESRAYVPHHGTWNGAPMAAAAGLATLRLIQDGRLVKMATDRADQLRDGLNGVFARHGVAGIAYGRSSIWKTYLGDPPRLLSGDVSRADEESRMLRTAWGPLAGIVRQCMILNGVDTIGTGGFVSVAHDDEDIERTVVAFDGTIQRLGGYGLL